MGFIISDSSRVVLLVVGFSPAEGEEIRRASIGKVSPTPRGNEPVVLPPLPPVTPVPGEDLATCDIIPGRETTIEITKEKSGLGLSIVGGTDTLLVDTPLTHLMRLSCLKWTYRNNYYNDNDDGDIDHCDDDDDDDDDENGYDNDDESNDDNDGNNNDNDDD